MGRFITMVLAGCFAASCYTDGYGTALDFGTPAYGTPTDYRDGYSWTYYQGKPITSPYIYDGERWFYEGPPGWYPYTEPPSENRPERIYSQR